MSLEEIWEQKLIDCGLENIEYGHSGMLKNTVRLNEDSQNYFIHLGKFINEYNFNHDFDELVWKLHAEGYCNNETARLVKRDRANIERALKRHRHEFDRFVIREVSDKWDDF